MSDDDVVSPVNLVENTDAVSARPFPVSDSAKDLLDLAGRKTLVLDGAAFPDLIDTVVRLGLDRQSLFGEPDLNVMEDEAPWLVALGDDEAASQVLLEFLDQADEGYVAVTSQASLQELSRHFKKWLSVRLPDETPHQAEEREKPVLFRFYDPAILVAFMMTLSPSEAAAFFGPCNKLITIDPGEGYVFEKTEATQDAPPITFPIGTYYQITPVQYQVLSNLAGDSFRDDLFRFLRKEYAAETTDLTDDQVHELIEKAIADGDRLEDRRPGSILNLAVIRLLNPEVLDDPFIWAEATERHPEAKNPNQRVGILMGYVITEFENLDEFQAYFDRIAKFGEGDF